MPMNRAMYIQRYMTSDHATSATTGAIKGLTCMKNPPPVEEQEGASVRYGWQSIQSNSLANRRFSRLRQAPRCHASLASSGRTLVASAKTICSIAVETLPQLAASCRVEDEQAPSRTSATVIWTAYLCTSTSS